MELTDEEGAKRLSSAYGNSGLVNCWVDAWREAKRLLGRTPEEQAVLAAADAYEKEVGDAVKSPWVSRVIETVRAWRKTKGTKPRYFIEPDPSGLAASVVDRKHPLHIIRCGSARYAERIVELFNDHGGPDFRPRRPES